VRSLPFCEAPECDAEPDVRVTGRWTIFDWLDVEVCMAHLVPAIKYLRSRTVDGLPCQEVSYIALDAAMRRDNEFDKLRLEWGLPPNM
jgi:hypothetical protein